MIKRNVLSTLVACTVVSSIACAQNFSDRANQVLQDRQAGSASNDPSMEIGRILGVLLYTDVTVQFDENEAREAFRHMSQILGVPIVARYNDDRTGEGIDPRAPITLDAQNMPALTVINMMLAQVEDFEPTTWQIRQGMLEVGTKDRLGAPGAQEIRYYPVRDMLMEVPYFDNAPMIDINSGGGGQGGGGRGGGGGGSGGGGIGSGGGGGGGFGGGGGGSGGGGGQGPFQGGGEPPERMSEEERAQELIDLIIEVVEREAWEDNGGEWATIRYYQGVLIVRAPDFVHRQLGGYPFIVPPSTSLVQSQSFDMRYVQLDGQIGHAVVQDGRVTQGGGAAAGAGGNN